MLEAIVERQNWHASDEICFIGAWIFVGYYEYIYRNSIRWNEKYGSGNILNRSNSFQNVFDSREGAEHLKVTWSSVMGAFTGRRIMKRVAWTSYRLKQMHGGYNRKLNHFPWQHSSSSSWFKASLSLKPSNALLCAWVLQWHHKILPCTVCARSGTYLATSTKLVRSKVPKARNPNSIAHSVTTTSR